MQLTQTIHHCVCSAPGTSIPQRERTRILLVLPKNLGFKPRFVDRSMPNTTHSAMQLELNSKDSTSDSN